MSVYDTFGAGLSAGLFVLLGWVVTQGESDFHQNALQLETRLEAAASLALKDAGFDWAKVEMDGQTAKLTGTPPTPEFGKSAESTVLASSGQGGLLWGGVVSVYSDYSDVTELPTVSPYVWRAVKQPNGNLIFVGSAPDTETSEALSTYLTLSEGASLENRVTPAAGMPDRDWPGMARFGMDQLALLDSGELRLTDLQVRLSGIAMDDAKRIEASAAIANIAKPWSGEAKISGPSLWQAAHVDGTLVLSGSTETEAHREEIRSIAEANFDGEVIDQMSVRETDYDDWIQGVRLGLPHFSDFKSGQMAFEPEGTGYSFEGEASSSTLQFLREDMATLEGPYGVDLAVEAVTIAVEELEGVELSEDPLIACQMSFDLIMQSNEVLFKTGSAEISRVSGETLDKIMAVSESCADDLRFEVAGHTDNTGDRVANLALSEARAQAVTNYMGNAGFDTGRLIVSGYGPDEPKGDNSTAEGRAANRRIEFRIQEWSE